ncbi:RnfH family protein [Faucicola boevrei]|uniref:RnfH family protein n=1 Tax=Faucicola boevrei TaxID=346665 RepID=UPI000379A041|nr:RnfH family protein [Moraxella boevrei]
MTQQQTTQQIEVMFCPTPNEQLHQKLSVASGTTAQQAVEILGWWQQFPQIQDFAVGVFSHKIDWQTVLQDGDRLEIYRPLTINPMQKRAKKMMLKAKKGYVIMKV